MADFMASQRTERTSMCTSLGETIAIILLNFLLWLSCFSTLTKGFFH
uniref:Uncharacterized protein n=1 Tax=Daphnia magna TaxID=35525 RepID=A0A0P5EFY5_9CRUS